MQKFSKIRVKVQFLGVKIFENFWGQIQIFETGGKNFNFGKPFKMASGWLPRGPDLEASSPPPSHSLYPTP